MDATLKKLEEIAALLNKAEGVNSYFVDTDETFDQWCIREIDDEHYFDHFLMEVSLFNGFCIWIPHSGIISILQKPWVLEKLYMIMQYF